MALDESSSGDDDEEQNDAAAVDHTSGPSQSARPQRRAETDTGHFL
jgi:hypothetical protein